MAVLTSIFGDLARGVNLQAWIDERLSTLQQNSIWRNYLNLGVPSPTLTFEAVIGRSRIEAAASIVDPDSKKPIRSRNKMETYTGSIPSIQQKIPMNQADFRAMMLLDATMPDADGRKRELMRLLFDDVRKAAVAPDIRVDIMLLQALSTLQVDVSITNNPDGVAYGTVNLLSKAYQKQGVPVAWTDAVNSKPLDDIETYAQFMWQNKGQKFARLLISFDLWINFKKNAQVRSYLQSFYNIGKANASFAATLDNVNEYMVANRLPIIEIIDYTAGIESDGVITSMRPFDPNNITFLPAGKIGTLENAIAIEERNKAEHVSYAMFDRTLVSKWQENDPIREWTGCELNAFPAVDIDQIFVLDTDLVQASFNTTE